MLFLLPTSNSIPYSPHLHIQSSHARIFSCDAGLDEVIAEVESEYKQLEAHFRAMFFPRKTSNSGLFHLWMSSYFSALFAE